MRRPSAVTGPLLVAVLLTGCSVGWQEAAGSTTASRSSSATAFASSSALTTRATDDRGCPASGHGVPAGADSAPTLDVDGDGVRDLAGLLADGTTVTRTAVELHGPRATNGRSATTASTPPAQLDLAHQFTCGALTLTDDGVSSNR